MVNFVFFGDIVEDNGKTIRQNNLEKKHNIPVGTLVEIISTDDEETETGEQRHGLRLFITAHTRDCDGSPLYSLAYSKTAYEEFEKINKLLETTKNEMELNVLRINKFILQGTIIAGYDEKSLKIISLK